MFCAVASLQVFFLLHSFIPFIPHPMPPDAKQSLRRSKDFVEAKIVEFRLHGDRLLLIGTV